MPNVIFVINVLAHNVLSFVPAPEVKLIAASGFTVTTIELLVTSAGVAQPSDEVTSKVTISLSESVIEVNESIFEPTGLPFILH